jgi:hypothetical protein
MHDNGESERLLLLLLLGGARNIRKSESKRIINIQG